MTNSDNNTAKKVPHLPPKKPSFLKDVNAETKADSKIPYIPQHKNVDKKVIDHDDDLPPPIPLDAVARRKRMTEQTDSDLESKAKLNQNPKDPDQIKDAAPKIKELHSDSNLPKVAISAKADEIHHIPLQKDDSQDFVKVHRRELEKEVIRANTFGAKRWLLFTFFFFLVSFVFLAYAFYIKDRVDYTYNTSFTAIKELKEAEKINQGKYEYYNSTITALNNENKAIKANIEDLKVQINNSNQEVTTYKKQINALDQDVATYKKQINALDKQVNPVRNSTKKAPIKKTKTTSKVKR